ncbi:Na+:solute symporter [candidate division KSB1 bacterium]|nr:Na+:solute symporter [candidate division KSB1 bacterium]
MIHIDMAVTDWIIVLIYILIALGIGIFYSKRATSNIDEYFVAGRKLPWWIAGTSMVATSFAADSPLGLTHIVRTQGLQGNWFWWSDVMAFILCAVLFAKFWNRAKLITDAEIYNLRYDGKLANGLRLFNAGYRSVIMNAIIMGWVILAATKIMSVILDIPSLVVMKNLSLQWVESANLTGSNLDSSQFLLFLNDKAIGVIICIIIATVYATLSGMWGVVVTDLIQFAIAMVGSFALAIISVDKLGGLIGMKEQIIHTLNSPNVRAELVSSDIIFSFAPDFSAGGLAISTFIIFIAIKWWGGAEGGGFLSQRIFACKNDRHATLAVLWFAFAHFVLRTWPWLIVGLASICFFPNLVDHELAYPLMINFLPTGLKGLMIASLLAAFMSTIDTHLNWGSSYIVTDFYKGFINKKSNDKQCVRLGQIASFSLMIIAGITAVYMDSIKSGWFYLAEIGSGLAFATLMRWFWWRVNPWSEISAMLSSLVIANAAKIIGKIYDIEFLTSSEYFAVRLALILLICTIIWIAVTLLTKPVSDKQLIEFYKKVRPIGLWGPIRKKIADPAKLSTDNFKIVLFQWSAGVISIYCLLFGIGKIILSQYLYGLILIVGGLIAAYYLVKRTNFSTLTPETTNSD